MVVNEAQASSMLIRKMSDDESYPQTSIHRMVLHLVTGMEKNVTSYLGVLGLGRTKITLL